MSTKLPDDGLLAPGASALAVALEQAAAAVARLDAALLGHPLAAAWAYRARLDAIRLQAAADGKAIDPWHLAALVEGVRLRLDSGAPLIDRSAIFDAARHAFALYRWYSRPADAQQAAISAAAAHLTTVADIHAPLLGAAYATHAWLDRGGDRPPLRAALAQYWVDRGVTILPCPLLTGTAALAPETPWRRAVWVGHFLQAVAAEAADGLALLRLIERSWWHARHACRRTPPRFACRRRDRLAGGRPVVVRDLARSAAGHCDQKRHSAARRVCHARHHQRGDPPVQTAALRAHASRPVARGHNRAAPAAARPPSGSAGRRGHRTSRRGCRRTAGAAGLLPASAPTRTAEIRFQRHRPAARSDRSGHPPRPAGARRAR